MDVLYTLRVMFCLAIRIEKESSKQSRGWLDSNNNNTGPAEVIAMKDLRSSHDADKEIPDPISESTPRDSQIAVMQTVATRGPEKLRFCSLLTQRVSLQGRDLRRPANEAVFDDVTLKNVVFLSLRDSGFVPSTLFAEMQHALEKLLVLDLGRTILLESDSSFKWPELRNLRELYLEGALQRNPDLRLEDILAESPHLVVLDLERAKLGDLDLVGVARLAPKLQRLYLGHTGLGDAPLIQLEKSGLGFKDLDVICLRETNVTHSGLKHLLKACPCLLSVSVKRSRVQQEAVAALEKSSPWVKIRRVEITHIFAVFPDRGCDHFTSKYGELPSAVVSSQTVGPDIFV